MVPQEDQTHRAQRLILKGQQLAKSSERNKNYIRTAKLFLDNDDWGP